MKTLQEIIASDIDDVFLTDFADDDIYTPNGGTAKTIKVKFNNNYVSVKLAGDVAVESCGPAILCKTSDVSGAKHNETHVINGTTYSAIEIQPDGTGMTTIILSKDAA